MRKVIFHYHFYKNAGTSVDSLLKANFPGQWATREFNASQHTPQISPVEHCAYCSRFVHLGQDIPQISLAEQWVRQEKDAIAFSSHTAMLPPPELKNAQFFPILFVRHPIDRIASIYTFERKQRAERLGPTLARNTSLSGYIDVRLSMVNDRQCRNFHVNRLVQMLKGEDGDETSLALRALDALPFVGLVEEFDQSIEHMVEWLSPHFPGFHSIPVAKNVTRDRSIPLEQRLAQIKAEIGSACYYQLLEANAGDIAVFEAVQKKLLYKRN